MTLRKATPQEAETLWNIRNQAIRHGCTTSYDAEVIALDARSDARTLSADGH